MEGLLLPIDVKKMPTKTPFMKNLLAAGTFALASLAFVGDAKALSLQFGTFVAGSETVNVSSPVHNGLAGAYTMIENGTGGSSFTVFCLDLLAYVRAGITYTYEATTTPFSNSSDTLNSTEIDRIQKLFNTGYDTALTNSVQSAGFQVALWNAIYDTDWDVSDTSADFFQTDTSSGVQAAADAFLSAAQGYTGLTKYSMTFLEGHANQPRSQNLVYVTSVPGDSTTPVPLPAAAWMLLTALGGLAFLRRRGQASA